MDFRERLNSSSIGSHRQNNWSIGIIANCVQGNKGAHTSNGNVTIGKTTGFGLTGKGIRIISWNINHVSNQMHELKRVLHVDHRPIDVFGISEMFLTSNDHDVRIKIDGYHQPERRDRSGKRGGGLVVNFSTALNYVRRRDLECDDLELIWTEIMPPRSTSVLVCFVYRSPKTMVRTDLEIVSNIENLLCLGYDVYVLGGVHMDLMKGTNDVLFNGS